MTDHEHRDGCILCTVRELTEGTPKTIWNGGADLEVGASISGVVLRQGKLFDAGPFSGEFVDLFEDEHGGRVRVLAYGWHIRAGLIEVAAIVGDRLTVTYLGQRLMEGGKLDGRPYRAYQVEVSRGHH